MTILIFSFIRFEYRYAANPNPYPQSCVMGESKVACTPGTNFKWVPKTSLKRFNNVVVDHKINNKL